MFEASGELDIRWLRTERGYWLRKQFCNINPTVSIQSFTAEQNLQQATDWLNMQEAAQTGPSSKRPSSTFLSSVWHCFCENYSV